jgi:hypothetical protein
VFVIVGASAQFSVTAAGSAPLTFQWRKNGVNITGATNSVLNTAATTLGDDGALFSCVVTNSCGSATSNNGTLQVAKKWSTIWAGSINTTCTGCHQGASPPGGLSLFGSAAAAYGNLVDINGVGVNTSTGNSCAGGKRVDPGNPPNSALFNVPGTALACISQNHTLITNALTPTQLQEIFDCIKAGFPNN